MQEDLSILEDLYNYIRKWSINSENKAEHINELLLEIELFSNQLAERSKKFKNFELFQHCLKLQDNLEILKENSPSPNQIKLLCEWPIQMRNYLQNYKKDNYKEDLKKFLCNSNWPSRYKRSEIDSLLSSDSKTDSNIQDKIKKGKYSKDCSPEQQELLDLINVELSVLLKSQKELASDIDKLGHDHKQLLEITEVQIEQIKRIGSASKMIGLSGLHQFCNHIQKNFAHIENKNPKQLISLLSQMLAWPEVIQAYLLDFDNSDSIQALLEYLSQENWPIKLSKQELNKLQALFNKSIVEPDISNAHKRIRKATPKLVSLKVSEDIDTDIFNSFMLDLPVQTEELSNAVQNLCDNNFLEYLEIAERITHTLKSAANTVGIQGIANLTHHLEDIFSALLKLKMKPSKCLHETIQNATDSLEEMSEYLEGAGSFPDKSVQVLQEILDWTNNIDEHGINYLKESKKGEVDSSVPQNLTAESKLNQRYNATSKNSKKMSTELSLRISACLVDGLLKRAGENIISNEQVRELVLHLKSSIQHLSTNNKKIKTLAQELDNLIGIRGFSPRQDSLTTNRDFDPLEMDQFNELHTFANQFMETSYDSVEFLHEIEESLLKLEKLSINQVRNLHENQEAVLRIRMIPVQSIVPRLKRAVRQACKSSNKLAKLEIFGEHIHVDSEYIHQLVDPIMHILRNAIDHGIETPDLRVKHSKNAEGKIQLIFKKEGNLIRVICRDDGNGLDLGLIKSKAIEKGLLNKNEEFTKELAIQIILQHGFSTKDKVSQLSGRGVGLAAVFTKIHEMKGSIEIETDKDVGVKVEIAIPTTFNSVHALIALCDDSTVAISNRGIDEILYAGAGNIISKSGQCYFKYLQQQYPVFDLQFMLDKTEKNSPVDDRVILIISDDANKKYAVTVDKIYDTRDVVVKPLGKFIPKILGLLGTTILGDGRIITVIDMIELIQTSSRSSETSEPSKKVQKSIEHQHALIVEDAISTRKSLAQFMRDIGFVVNTAKDGVEAINLIQKQIPSIVLTDLEMPRMNGLELSDHLRSNKETEFTPIIMITSKSTEKHREEAKRLGVSAYITKPYDEDELLELINSFKVIA